MSSKDDVRAAKSPSHPRHTSRWPSLTTPPFIFWPQVKRAEKEVDKVTDGFSEKVDREVAKKEAEVMEV
jgi:hypothetical protein